MVNWSWGQDEEEFPYTPPEETHIHPWEFFEPPSDSNGVSVPVGTRITPDLASAIDELVFVARSHGVKLRHRADFARWALRIGAERLQAYLENNFSDFSPSESSARYMKISQSLMKRGYASSNIHQIRDDVNKFIKGLDEVLPVNHDGFGREYEEAFRRIKGELSDILNIPDSEGFSKRQYMRVLISSHRFNSIVKELEDNGYSLNEYYRLKEIPESVD